LLEAGDIAYLANAIRTNAELRIRAERPEPQDFGETWPDLMRLLRRLLARLWTG